MCSTPESMIILKIHVMKESLDETCKQIKLYFSNTLRINLISTLDSQGTNNKRFGVLMLISKSAQIKHTQHEKKLP